MTHWSINVPSEWWTDIVFRSSSPIFMFIYSYSLIIILINQVLTIISTQGDFNINPPIYIYIYIHGWWLTYPTEKYEFVSWDAEIPNWMGSHSEFHGSSHHQAEKHYFHHQRSRDGSHTWPPLSESLHLLPRPSLAETPRIERHWWPLQRHYGDLARIPMVIYMGNGSWVLSMK